MRTVEIHSTRFVHRCHVISLILQMQEVFVHFFFLVVIRVCLHKENHGRVADGVDAKIALL